MAYDKQFMDMAIELAKECALQDEVPVGCVVVKDGKVVGASGNRKERENNAICHAEILALSEATKAVGKRLLGNHFEGIIAHATYNISAGKIEGINNKIKTIRRQGYGYPDDEYFFLKLFDMSRWSYERNPKSHKICD